MKAPKAKRTAKTTAAPTSPRWATDRAPKGRYFAVTLKKVRGGFQVDHVTERPTLGEAERYNLTLLGRWGGDVAAITLERELVNGEVLDAALLKRRA